MIKVLKNTHELHFKEERKKQTLHDYNKEMLHLASNVGKLQTKVRQMEKATTVMEEEAFE